MKRLTKQESFNQAPKDVPDLMTNVLRGILDQQKRSEKYWKGLSKPLDKG